LKILALDTATEALSVALLIDEDVLERSEVIGRGHAERLLPLADEILRGAGVALGELDAIAFGRGPGAFTGVRIAISVAQGLSLGSGVPLIPVSDLEALGCAALGNSDADYALACLDARMGEVYYGLVERGLNGEVKLVTEGLAPPAAVPELPRGARIVAAGHGFSAFPSIAERFSPAIVAIYPDLLPAAATIARLARRELAAGRVFSACEVEPTYLRNDVATRSSRAAGNTTGR
jgi:tRNA threonylcarbamoyladenosine biosynthesis protein TsaB